MSLVFSRYFYEKAVHTAISYHAIDKQKLTRHNARFYSHIYAEIILNDFELAFYQSFVQDLDTLQGLTKETCAAFVGKSVALTWPNNR